MPLTHAAATERFLESLGYYGAEQDEVDVDHLKDVHWDAWERHSARINMDEWLHHADPRNDEPQDDGEW